MKRLLTAFCLLALLFFLTSCLDPIFCPEKEPEPPFSKDETSLFPETAQEIVCFNLLSSVLYFPVTDEGQIRALLAMLRSCTLRDMTEEEAAEAETHREYFSLADVAWHSFYIGDLNFWLNGDGGFMRFDNLAEDEEAKKQRLDGFDKEVFVSFIRQIPRDYPILSDENVEDNLLFLQADGSKESVDTNKQGFSV